jgi:hypothetical protein
VGDVNAMVGSTAIRSVRNGISVVFVLEIQRGFGKRICWRFCYESLSRRRVHKASNKRYGNIALGLEIRKIRSSSPSRLVSRGSETCSLSDLFLITTQLWQIG